MACHWYLSPRKRCARVGSCSPGATTCSMYPVVLVALAPDVLGVVASSWATGVCGGRATTGAARTGIATTATAGELSIMVMAVTRPAAVRRCQPYAGRRQPRHWARTAARTDQVKAAQRAQAIRHSPRTK